MNTPMRQLPEFIQSKKDMERLGETVVVYDDGTPYVHTFGAAELAQKTDVTVDWFVESFDGATECLFPIEQDAEPHERGILSHIARESARVS